MQSVQRFIFGPTPQERVKEWQAQLRKEKRGLEREIRQMDDGQRKAKAQLKQLANKGETKNARILAREFVRSKKASQRLHSSVAQLNSINMQLSHQLATLKITGHLEKSTEIMKLANSLVKLPELQGTMMNMSKEMMKAGILSEMMEESLDALDEDQDELEAEADAEVDAVLFDITDGKLGQAGRATSKIPEARTAAEIEEEDAENERMQAQLDSLLRS